MKKATILLLGSTLAMASLASYADDQVREDITVPSIKPGAKTEAKTKIGELTGNFDITSNYMFRGMSQSDNLPAVQGGLTYTFLIPGIYFSLWGSNVNQTDVYGSQATLELDTVAGIANPIGDHFSYDLSIARYNYPSAGGLNYNEFIAIANYYFLTGTLGYSTNVYNTHKTGTYLEGGVNYDVPPQYIFDLNNVNLAATYGHYSLPRSAGLFSYNTYTAQVSKKISNYTITVQWIGTDGRAHLSPLDDNRLVGTILVDF